jgi:DNA-binding MarR family transcriptional regulator
MASRWLDDREQRAWGAFLDLWRGLGAGMERQLSGSGVSGAEYQVLAPLGEASGKPLRPRELIAATGWDRSRLAHQLGRMERRGLLTREDHPDDGRGTLVRLTDAGRTALRRAAPGHVDWVRTHFIGLLSSDELDTLTAIAERVVATLEQPSGGPSADRALGSRRSADAATSD